MHLIVSVFSKPKDWYWIPGETWLIVMIVSAAAVFDAWRSNRTGESGFINSVWLVFGAAGAFSGAFGYVLMTVRPDAAPNVLGIVAWLARPVAVLLSVLYLLYRWPSLQRDAKKEAKESLGRIPAGRKK